MRPGAWSIPATRTPYAPSTLFAPAHGSLSARHPSPLYQAFAEGVALFALVWWTASRRPRPGVVSGVFLAGYGALRLITERFRAPDGHLGFMLMDAVTMGDLLSLPMVIIGVTIIFWATSRPGQPPAKQA